MPIPSAASSTSAPGQSCRVALGNGAERERVAALRAAAPATTALIMSSRLWAAPLRLPFATSSPSILTSQEHRLRVELVGRDHAGPDRDRHAVGRARPARRSRRVPASRSRACSRTRAAASSSSGIARSSTPEHRRDLRLVLEPRRARRARAPPARGRRSAVRRRGRRASAGSAGTAGVRMRGRFTRHARRRRAPERRPGGVHDGASAARDEIPRAWWGRPDARRRRAGRPPHPRGSPPVAAAPRGRR